MASKKLDTESRFSVNKMGAMTWYVQNVKLTSKHVANEVIQMTDLESVL